MLPQSFKQHYYVLTEAGLADRANYLVKQVGAKWNQMWEDRWEGNDKAAYGRGFDTEIPGIGAIGGPQTSLFDQLLGLNRRRANQFNGPSNPNISKIVNELMKEATLNYRRPRSDEELAEEFKQLGVWDPSGDKGKFLPWIVNRAVPQWLKFARAYSLPSSRDKWDEWEDGQGLRKALEKFMEYSDPTNKDYKDIWYGPEGIKRYHHYEPNNPDQLVGNDPGDINSFKSLRNLASVLLNFERRNDIVTDYYEGDLEDLAPGDIRVAAKLDDIAAVQILSWKGNETFCLEMGWCVTNDLETLESYYPLFVFVRKIPNTGKIKFTTDRWKAIALYSKNKHKNEFRRKSNVDLDQETVDKIKEVAFQLPSLQKAMDEYTTGAPVLSKLEQFYTKYIGFGDGNYSKTNPSKMGQIYDLPPIALNDVIDLQYTGTKSYNDVFREAQDIINNNTDKAIEALVTMMKRSHQDNLNMTSITGHELTTALTLRQSSVRIYTEDGYDIKGDRSRWVYNTYANVILREYEFLEHMGGLPFELGVTALHTAQEILQTVRNPLAMIYNKISHRVKGDEGKFARLATDEGHDIDWDKMKKIQQRMSPEEWVRKIDTVARDKILDVRPEFQSKVGYNINAPKLTWIMLAVELDWSKVIEALPRDEQFIQFVDSQLMGPDVYKYWRNHGVYHEGELTGGGPEWPRLFRTDIDVRELGK